MFIMFSLAQHKILQYTSISQYQYTSINQQVWGT